MFSILFLTFCFHPYVLALHGIRAPSLVTADRQFQVTFENGGSDPRDHYRVFLAAASVGQNGPMCYLQNLTSLISPFTATIPASVGPDGDDYSIGIADITTSQGATFGNRFNFTGGTGEHSPYEKSLGGAPFWNAYDLPCSAVSCARQCAQAGFPADLTDDIAYAEMKTCIEACPGVSINPSATRPTAKKQTVDLPVAIVTMASDLVVTAWQTVISTDGSSITKAVVGTRTLTLGSAVQTLSSATVSLGSDGLVVGGSSTVPFSTTTSLASSTSRQVAETVAAKGEASVYEDMLLAMAGLAAVAAALVI